MSQYWKYQKFCPWEISYCDFGLFTHMGLLSLALYSVNIDTLQQTIVVTHIRFTVFTQLRFDIAKKIEHFIVKYTSPTMSKSLVNNDELLENLGCVLTCRGHKYTSILQRQCSINNSGIGPVHVDLRGLRSSGYEGTMEGWGHIHKLRKLVSQTTHQCCMTCLIP